MTFFATLGNDFFRGSIGAISDTVSYATGASGGVRVNLSLAGAQTTGGSGLDTFISIENVIGSLFDDIIQGSAGGNLLDGGPGIYDTLSYDMAASGVQVSLSVTTPQNTLGAGIDTLLNFENLIGSSFNDVLSGNAGNNRLDGGAGIDTVSYANASAGVTLSLSTTFTQNTVGAGFDQLSNFENLTGSNFNDTLSGDAGNNVLNGGAGIDTVSYANAGVGVTVSLSTREAQNTRGAGRDTLSNFENLTGSNFNDTLSGDAGNNVLDGGTGIDTVSYANAGAGVTVSLGWPTIAQNTVGAGVDTLRNFENLTGSSFDDRLTGDSTANVLNGGSGRDVLTGRAGVDRFVFNFVTDSENGAPDRITDFDRLVGEMIDVSAIDANTSIAGNQAFIWRGSGDIRQGEMGFQAIGSDVFLVGNTSGTIDFRVLIQGSALSSLIAADVIL